MPTKSGARTASAKLSSVNVLSELQRFGWPYNPISDDEVKVRCPKHDDQNPSVSLNVKSGLWKCHTGGCEAHGDFIAFLAYAQRVDRKAVVVLLSERYDLGEHKTIDPRVVEGWHEKVWNAGPLLQALRERGISDAMVRAARLGYADGRITIPVYDAEGRVVNVRRYLPGAPTDQKMLNTRGFGEMRLYQPRDAAEYDRVVVCGGEMKALLVKHMLNPHGFGAVSSTGGEGSWDPRWGKLFAGKQVWVCMDVDAPGQEAAKKLALALQQHAVAVHLVKLPLNPEKYPKGDVNDYVGREAATAEDLLALLGATPRWKRPDQTPRVSEVERVEVDLAGASAAVLVGRPMRVAAVVSAIDTTPYLVPKTALLTCSKDQPGCGQCAAYGVEPEPGEDYMTLRLPPTSPGVVEMAGAGKAVQLDALSAALGLAKCKVAQLKVRDHHEALDVRLTPQLQIASQKSADVVQAALVVGPRVELNVAYSFGGTLWAHPKNQQAVLLLSEASEAQDSLNSFKLRPEDHEALRVFEPREWTIDGLQTKLDELYSDLEANVTRVYGRRKLHLVVDLAYHSPLLLQFDGRTVNGWVNALVLGDSSQGKTEATTRLMEHYQLGERTECKSATVAGLLGGLQQMGGNRWFVSWGVIPTHDRRLVFLEEVKGASVEVLSKLTDMRSSGVAEIPKIERRRTHARTRLVFISNPRGSRPMSSYNFGIEAIQELIGGLEDVRRFDVATVLSSREVSPADMREWTTNKRTAPHVHRSDACRKLVLWCWTLRPEQVTFEAGAERAALDRAASLCDKYTEDFPLLDRGTARLKVARLAAALAGRTHSADTEGRLVVRPCHVDYVADFLDAGYSDPVFGYADFSKAVEIGSKVSDPGLVRRQLLGTKHPADLVKQLLYRDEVTLQDLQDWTGSDRDTAQVTLSLLVRKCALVRCTRVGYRKSPEFIKLLKDMQAGGKLPQEGQRDADDKF